MKHAIIGANIIDRLVKCPGSLKVGNGSLADHDAKQAKKRTYTQNRIECNEATSFGQIVDDLAKNYIYYARTGNNRHMSNAKPEHECDPKYFVPADKYAKHILKVARRFDAIFLDAKYDMSEYMYDLPDCEFRVMFNPDVAIMNADRSGVAFISDLSTARCYDRNKMFQVLCCAIGMVKYFPKVTHVICEVYNSTTEEVQYTRFSREELEAYRDDVLVPALQKVRDALEDSSTNIEQYRHYCSWCNHFCVLADEGCQACKCKENPVENDIPINLHFFIDLMNEDDKAAYNNLFTLN